MIEFVHESPTEDFDYIIYDIYRNNNLYFPCMFYTIFQEHPIQIANRKFEW